MTPARRSLTWKLQGRLYVATWHAAENDDGWDPGWEVHSESRERDGKIWKSLVGHGFKTAKAAKAAALADRREG